MPAKTRNKYALGGTASSFHELTLPSRINAMVPDAPHNVCLVRRVGVEGLIKAGILDSLDSLTGLVKSEHLDRTGATRPGKTERMQDDIKHLIAHKEELLEAMALVDRVVEYVVVEPKVHRPIKTVEGDPERAWVELPDEERDPTKLYTDQVDEDDKMFIFQYVVGGTSDLETFRKERAELLDGLADSAGVPDDTVGSVGDNG